MDLFSPSLLLPAGPTRLEIGYPVERTGGEPQSSMCSYTRALSDIVKLPLDSVSGNPSAFNKDQHLFALGLPAALWEGQARWSIALGENHILAISVIELG